MDWANGSIMCAQANHFLSPFCSPVLTCPFHSGLDDVPMGTLDDATTNQSSSVAMAACAEGAGGAWTAIGSSSSSSPFISCTGGFMPDLGGNALFIQSTEHVQVAGVAPAGLEGEQVGSAHTI